MKRGDHHDEELAWYGSPWQDDNSGPPPPPAPPDDKHTTGPHAERAPKDQATLARVGVVLGRFCPPHVGHVHLVQEAFARCGLLYVLYSSRGFDRDPHYLHQYGVVRSFSPYATVEQLYIGADDPKDPRDPRFAQRYASKIRERVGNVTTLFSSDANGGAAAVAHELGVEHVLIDPERKAYPISATQIRNDFWGKFRFIAPEARTFYAVHAAIVGVEGSGKSTLARELATALEAAVVDDALLAEAERTGAVPSAKAFAAAIFDSYRARDAAAAACTSGVVVDDNARTLMRMWAERLGVPLDEYSRKLAGDYHPELFLHCAPDFPFTPPPGRAHDPAARAAFDEKLRAFLDENEWRRAKTVRIAGGGQDRVAAAVATIEKAKAEKLERVLKALAR